MESKLKVLVIAQAFTPLTGSHATRVTELSYGLAKLGCSVHVVTATLPNKLKNFSGYPKGVVVHRGYVGPLHSFKYAKTDGFPGVISEGNSVARRLAVPDTFIEWLPGGILKGLSHFLKCGRPDIIVSSAVPYTAHLIAWVLHRIFHVPWVADYGDPWVFDPGHPRKGIRFHIEYNMENWVLKKTSGVIVTTRATKELYLKNFRHLRQGKIYVLPMGYGSDMFREAEEKGVSKSKHPPGLALVYTGSLRSESRNTEPFLRALATVSNKAKQKTQIQFTILGSVDKRTKDLIAELALDHIITLTGWVDKGTVVDTLKRSDVAVLFGNNNSIQTPGKIFEYIGSGTPIVYVKDHVQQGDECEDYLLQSGRAYWVVQNEEQQIVEWLKEAFSSILEVRNLKQMGDPRKCYTWDARAEELYAILKQIAEKG